METQTVFYVNCKDENMGTIWTLLAPQDGEKLIRQMTLREFADMNWSGRDDEPTRGDLHGILTELLNSNYD